MRFSTVAHEDGEQAAVIRGDDFLRMPEVVSWAGVRASNDLMTLIAQDRLPEMWDLAHSAPVGLWRPREYSRPAPLFRRPGKIWGIGLNYREHAADLHAPHPQDEPASFMKPATAIIGPGQAIRLPPQSQRVTGEAELALVIGRTCRNVTAEEAPAYVAGCTLVLDMTAEDILQRNPRFLTRAKSFDTFFSIGPDLITLDEIEDIEQLSVRTILNGVVERENIVANMTFKPFELVAFHSQGMTLEPGDILATGTPGAVVLHPGDRLACEIPGLGRLENPVVAG